VGTAGRWSPTARPRGRFDPLLVVVAVAACVPPAVMAGPSGGPDGVFLVGGGVLALAAVAAHHLGRGATARHRELLGTALAAAAATLFVVLVARSSLRTVDFLGIGAALIVSMAAFGRDRVRWVAQASVLLALAVLLALEHRDAPLLEALIGVLAPIGLVGAVTVLTSALASDLEDARHGAAVTRRHLASRAELLDLVRTVVHSGRDGAAHVTVEALRALGSDAAAVAVVVGDELVPREVVGLKWTTPLPVGEAAVARMLASDGAQVFEDYRGDPDRVVDVGLGTVIVVPIRFDGRAQGVVVAGRRAAGRPHEGDVEAAEVLAAHLGAALAAERSERNQDRLLARLRELEALRSGFVDRVSEDLRDPLTIVRGVAQTLATHGSRLEDDQREELLRRLTVQADDLGTTLEALLDITRLQVQLGEPALVPIDVFELLRPALVELDVVVRGPSCGPVEVDPELVRRSIDLLLRAALTVPDPLDLEVTDDEVSIELRRPGHEGLESGFTRALAEQLLVSAGARGERTPEGFRLRLPRTTDEVSA
jgi:K+-sensing histidine kinase KdpD